MQQVKAVACTLGLDQMPARLERLRRLAVSGLRTHRLDGRVLHLSYHLDAAPELKALVALERDCCAFLDFDLQVARGEVRLAITAPEGADDAAQWLFAQFLPPAPQPAAARTSCCASCA